MSPPRPLLALPLVLAALLAPRLAHPADVVALLPATGANLDAGTLAAARDVFRSHLEKTGREVRLAAGDLAAEPSPAEAAAAGQTVGAGSAAVLRLSALGTVVRIRLAVYQVPGGRLLHADDLAAGSQADLDPVLQRLAQGYASGAGAASSATIETVTDKEARPQNRITATRAVGLRLGAITPLNPSGLAVGTGGGMFWLYDSRSFLVDVSVDLYFGRDYHDTALGFGAYLPFLQTNVTPYLGGGIKYAFTRFEGSWSGGLQPYAAGGVLVGRLSTVQIRGEAAWFYDLFTNAGKNRSGLLWSVGVAF